MSDKRSITSALNLAKARAARATKKQAEHKDQLVAEFQLKPVDDDQSQQPTIHDDVRERLDKLYELFEADRKERAERRAQKQKEREAQPLPPKEETKETPKPVPQKAVDYSDIYG
jgi:hypothetical protein